MLYGELEGAKPVSPRHIPLLERLERDRAQIQQKLDEIDEAIAVLKDNPGFQKILDTLSKVTNRL